jgi:TRAP-type C4-dicarboxylate transport system substrate-binding protein
MKRSSLIIATVTLVLILALVLPACTEMTTTPTSTPEPSVAPTATAPAEAKTLKLAYTMPKGRSIAAGFEWFASEFEKRTDGRYKVETYPGASLMGIHAVLDSLKGGTAELAMTSTGTFPNNFPLTLVTGLPTLGFQLNDMDTRAAADAATLDFIKNTPEVNAEYQDFQLLWPFQLDAYYLVSKMKEIHQASDFKGMKVGGSGAKMEIVSANGGAAVQMGPPDAYLNLDKGTAEAAFLTISQVRDYKITEICDYFYSQDFGNGLIMMMMNNAAWADLGPADQQIMTSTWKDAAVESNKGSYKGMLAGYNFIEENGKVVIAPTAAESAAWTEAASPTFDTWKEDAMKLGATAETCNKVLAKWTEMRDSYK